MLSKKDYSVILYYVYTNIDNPEKFREEHLRYCQKLELLGRIIVAKEGLNGTISGLRLHIDIYITQMKKDPRFNQVDFKIDEVDGHVFPKLSIKVRDEIVASKLLKDLKPYHRQNSYLEPKKFYQWLKNKDIFLLDVRNNYEYKLGHFQNAINPNINNFRDLPQWLEQKFLLLKNKIVLTYCTGGVRCEKVTLFLKEKGCKNVYQLKGGILKYSQDEEVQGELFKGQMYVFDQRKSILVNKKKHTIVGKDFFDKKPCERYINCANPQCNKQILCSEYNEHKYLSSCCQSCREAPQNSYVMKHNLKVLNNKEQIDK
ncbi:oxygen-dependent tRNA uridine(34) hydroxylase TrhO [Candidatus Phytoplasma phoenicium]|nr:rhodanese-related sulfurtransferase [Candidatus Phytoplasma phoenicium]